MWKDTDLGSSCHVNKKALLRKEHFIHGQNTSENQELLQRSRSPFFSPSLPLKEQWLRSR